MTGTTLRRIRATLAARTGHRLTARAFAGLLNVPMSTYYRWESPGPIPHHAASLIRAYLALVEAKIRPKEDHEPGHV